MQNKQIPTDLDATNKTPTAVAQVETAIPAFIGFTEKTASKGYGPFSPVKFYNIEAYEKAFGKGAPNQIEIAVSESIARELKVEIASFDAAPFQLYPQLLHYKANSNRPFYVVSLGTYADFRAGTFAKAINRALASLAQQPEPDLLVFADTPLLSPKNYRAVAEAMLNFASGLPKRFVIFNLPHINSPDLMENFRSAIGQSNLAFGAAYYPGLRTETQLSVHHSAVRITSHTRMGQSLGSHSALIGQTLTGIQNTHKKYYDAIVSLLNSAAESHYLDILPAGAVAGIFAAQAATQGVWKAPANVSLQGVRGAALPLDRQQQQQMNNDSITGKSVNPILDIRGGGTRIMGARTLAGNDNEWRFVPVRLLANMIENSLRGYVQQLATLPNNQNTHLQILQGATSFLSDLWRQGALQGTKPEDAFYCRMGLGTTMSPEALANGLFRLEYGLAAMRPREYIVNRIEVKQQNTVYTQMKGETTTEPPMQRMQADVLLTGQQLTARQAIAMQALVASSKISGEKANLILLFGSTSQGRAQIVAAASQHLKKEVYIIDSKALATRYIGETEKNLHRMLRTAQAKDWILFFDEADALFGKRTQVSSKSVRDLAPIYATLQQHSGIIIYGMMHKKDCAAVLLRRLQAAIRVPA